MLKDIIGHDQIKLSLKKIKGNLPQIFLFSGPKGVGKYHTTVNFLDDIYEGNLSSKNFNHPDILYLIPETNTFKLELINSMKNFISETSFELDRKYVILRDVHLMNKESANSCLKIFEDCPKNTVFFLLSENSELVLDTIRSRSQIFEFKPINNLKKYISDISDLENKLLGGCLGLRKILSNLDIDKIYSETVSLLIDYPKITYSEIIDWYISHKDIDFVLLNNIFTLAALDLSKSNTSLNTSLLFLESCKDFKDKIESNLKLDMHFKNMLLQNRVCIENKKEISKKIITKQPKEESIEINEDVLDNSLNKHNFEECVNPCLDNFVKITFSEEELIPLHNFVDKVVKEKMKEEHYKIDSGSLKKRFFTGFLGEMAISLIFEKNTVDWAIGNSKIFNKADLKAIGRDIGIKTVEWGKFPIVHKNPKRPEIINLRKENTIYVCGIATPENMLKNSTDDLVISEDLRKRNVKTGFYGFSDLKFFPKERIIEKLNRGE